MKNYKSAYEIFTDPKELKIAERIQNLRYCMLVHSCVYYRLSDNIISDSKWNTLAHELADLQNQYPSISGKVTLAEYFKDWDGSSGAFLPLDLDWVMQKAKNAVEQKNRIVTLVSKPKAAPKKPQKKKSTKRKLF